MYNNLIVKGYLNIGQYLKCLIGVLIISLSVFCMSCKDTSVSTNDDESQLIKKINAVHQQIMAQGNITPEEEQGILSLCSIVSHSDGLANVDTSKRMLLKDVDIAPVYLGCEAVPVDEIKACFKDNIVSFIKREFNQRLSKNLHLLEPEQVDVFFMIDEKGQIAGMKVRDSEVTIQAEILRVLRKLPAMKPAIHNGEIVSVLCSMIVHYGNELNIDIVYIPERPE